MEPIIEIRHLQKHFGSLQVLNDIDFNIEKGEVVTIIGSSGSGKSTMLRCINMLETPSGGEILFHGKNIAERGIDVNQYRSRVGMVFQNFNLFANKTVLQNCMLGQIKVLKKSKEEARERAMMYLRKVGMEAFANAGSVQLSGGQKQRVAIARALANDPKVLLCDEATSALDPQTTHSILKLIKDINQKLNLTVVLITHEMGVVKEICDRVAVMEDGRVVEEGSIVDIFTHPQAKMTKSFIASTSTTDRIYDLIEEGHALTELGEDEVIVSLKYDASNATQALISEISRTYDVDCNIIFGNIEVVKDTPIGTLIVVLKGDPEKRKAAFDCIKRHGVETEVIKR